MIGTRYDIVIVGGGHNGLVAACYLAKAGLSVLVLEREADLGGATRSKRVFDGVDANLSVYSYLVSLLPEKIVNDLGLQLQLRSRKTSSWTPGAEAGRELFVRNGDAAQNREAFVNLTGDDRDYRGYLELAEMQHQVAEVVWPSLTRPLVGRETMRRQLGGTGAQAWEALIERPLGEVVEELISDDLVRGVVFTDAKIGVSTHPQDDSLIQNRCFLYHVIGRGGGEWRVPVGGMGALVDGLRAAAEATGKVSFITRARATGIDAREGGATVAFDHDGGEREVDSRYVLCGASAEVLASLTGSSAPVEGAEGAGFKINMLLKRLPRLRSGRCDAGEAFAGTVHIDEGYEQMIASYRQSLAGELPVRPPGEIYCHTLTDSSILADELREAGCHTLTLFGLDMPYRLFVGDDGRVREEACRRYLAGINRYLDEPIEDCLAEDVHGEPCIEAMSAFDLEKKIHLPMGNIFHGDLSWPFAENEEETGTWGVETAHPSVFLCGSAAARGGAVSGIPGHNAAMKVLELIGESSALAAQ